MPTKHGTRLQVQIIIWSSFFSYQGREWFGLLFYKTCVFLRCLTKAQTEKYIITETIFFKNITYQPKTRLTFLLIMHSFWWKPLLLVQAIDVINFAAFNQNVQIKYIKGTILNLYLFRLSVLIMLHMRFGVNLHCRCLNVKRNI